jgi:hypothetical protein
MRFTTSSFAVKQLTLLLTVGSVNAFWRMPCRSRSGLARVDPLVSFGTTSEHAHVIHGSSGMFTFSPTIYEYHAITRSCLFVALTSRCPKVKVC